MINKIRSYLLDDEFRMTVLKDKINICNYDVIDYLDDDRISIKCLDCYIVIKGERLSVIKLLNDEILIKGQIKTIEMR